MTLRLHKVTQQIDRLRENAVARAGQQRADLPKVQRAFTAAAQIGDLPQKARRAAESGGYSGAMPTAGESISLRKGVPPLPPALSLLAVDGSQVYPDRHAASLFYAINIGYFRLRFDTGEADANSEPTIVFEEESLFPEGNLVSNTILNARRTAEEMAALAERACAERAAAPARPVLALADGSLALRIDEKTFPGPERGVLRHKFFAAIDRLAAETIPVAGYIARPGGYSVLSLIDLALRPAPDSTSGRGRGGRSPFPGLDDRVLFESLLPSGNRSAVFESAAPWNDDYRARTPNQSVHFFYLNVGKRYPVIARVEIPEWTASVPALINRVHAALIEQCAVTLNDPYPYALIRADEEAFVSGEEKKYLEEQMAVALIRGGLQVNRSEKLSHKGRARKH
jgi:hypothetical protein